MNCMLKFLIFVRNRAGKERGSPLHFLRNSCHSSCNVAYSLDLHQLTGGSVIAELFTACRWRSREIMAGVYT